MEHCVACKYEGDNFIKINTGSAMCTMEDVKYENGMKLVNFVGVSLLACPECFTVRMKRGYHWEKE